MPDSQPWYSVTRPCSFWSRRFGQPAVPAHQIGPAPVEERLGDRAGGAAARAGVVEDALHRDRVHRRLGDPGGVPAARRVGGQRRAVAQRAGPGEVSVDPVGEHDVRDHAVGPLRRQQGVELDDGPLHAQRGQADRPRTRRPSSTCAGTAAAPPWSSRPGRCRAAGRRRGPPAASGAKLGSNATRSFCVAVRESQVGRVTGMPTALDHRGRRRASVPPSPRRWRPPTPCCWPAGRRRGSTPSPTRLGATTWPLDLTDPDVASRPPPSRSPSSTCWSTTPAWPIRGGSPSRRPSSGGPRFEVNVTGAVALTLALLPALRGRARAGGVHQLRRGPQRLTRAGVVLGEQVRAARRSPTRCAPTNRRCGSPASTPAGSTPRCSSDLVAYEGGEYDPSDS